MTVPLLPEGSVHLRWTERIRARVAVAIAAGAIRLSPAKLRRFLGLLGRSSRPASPAQARRAREAVCTVSAKCAGLGCLQRSVAAFVYCRMAGATPDWCTGFRTEPFAAHAWIEVDEQAVGEPGHLEGFNTAMAVRPHRWQP